jgi:hypothetical protein
MSTRSQYFISTSNFDGRDPKVQPVKVSGCEHGIEELGTLLQHVATSLAQLQPGELVNIVVSSAHASWPSPEEVRAADYPEDDPDAALMEENISKIDPKWLPRTPLDGDAWPEDTCDD